MNFPRDFDCIEDVLARIESLQAVQKRNRPTSAQWIEASNELKPLFEHMARVSSAKEQSNA
jgi:hypothetical protein